MTSQQVHQLPARTGTGGCIFLFDPGGGVSSLFHPVQSPKLTPLTSQGTGGGGCSKVGEFFSIPAQEISATTPAQWVNFFPKITAFVTVFCKNQDLLLWGEFGDETIDFKKLMQNAFLWSVTNNSLIL